MITRYQVNFEDRMIEPDPHGRWVKFEDCTHIESAAAAKAEEHARTSHAQEREELANKTEQVALLTAACERFETELQNSTQERDITIERQRFLLKAARDRLRLLGHSPNCESRYSTISVGGAAAIGQCDCGLDAWMRESGVGHG